MSQFAEVIRQARAKLAEMDPEQRRLAEQHIKVLEAEARANPLFRFEPYAKQAEFLSSRHRTKAFFAGDRTGKTTVGVIDDLIQCVDSSVLPSWLRRFKRWEPPFYMRIVFPKFGQGDLAVINTLREWVPKDQLRGNSFDKALEKQPNLRLHFKNGSWIVFNTGDQDRDVHAGVKLHRVHFDEEPQGERGWDVYQENRSRLVDFARDPGSQMMFTMTPKNGLTWTYDEIWAHREADNVLCLSASMYDNPHLPVEEIRLREAEMSEEEAEAAVHGRFIAFGGRVMNLEARHLIEPPSPDWVRRLDAHYVCIDPGWRRGGVAFAGFDDDNALVVFDELYPERLTPDEIVPQIRAKLRFWGVPFDEVLFLIDPAAKAGQASSGESVETHFNRMGVYPSYGQNDRLAGALQLKARLQSKPSGLLISKACTNLLWESERWLVARDEDAERHRAKVKGAGGGFATIGPDHIADCVRYLSMERLWWDGEHSSPATESWEPGTAPSTAWLNAGAPRGDGFPMGQMS